MPFRTIDTDIWNNAWFYDLKPAQKIMYIFLFSNPMISNIGVLEVSRKQFASTTGVSLVAANKFLSELEQRGQVVIDEQLILLTKFIAKQTHFGNDTEVNKNDRLLKNLRQLWEACPSVKLRRALACAYPTLFEEEQTSSVPESSPLSAQDKPLVQEEEAPSSCEASPLSTEGKPLAQQKEGSSRDIGDNRDIGERIDPPLPPLGKPDAVAPADTESGSEVAHADVSVPEQPVSSPETTQSESLEPEQSVLSPEQPEKHKRKKSRKDRRDEPPVRPQDFKRWYSLFPRKDARQDAVCAWNDADEAGVLPEISVLERALEWQIPANDWTINRRNYIPLPATYINARRWQDEPPSRSQPQFQRKRFDPDSYTREDFANLPENPDGSVDWKKLGVF